MLKFFKNTKNFSRTFSTFKKTLDKSIKIREKMGIEPEVLNYNEVENLIKELQKPREYNYQQGRNNEWLPNLEEEFLINQFKRRILPGVDDTSRLKANFLYDIATEKTYSPLISKFDSIKILGSMQGGYSIEALVNLLNTDLSENVANQLKNNILIFDYFYNIEKMSKNGNKYANDVLNSWANAEWFTKNSKLPEKITLTCFKVTGEINTDDLSPAQDAWSRPDIPLHAQSMLKVPRDGIVPDNPYEIGPIETINWLKQKGNDIAFVGDVVGTGSSRKSATNSILWHFGKDIPFVIKKMVDFVW